MVRTSQLCTAWVMALVLFGCGRPEVSIPVTLRGDVIRTGDPRTGGDASGGDTAGGDAGIIGECNVAAHCTSPNDCEFQAGVTCVNHVCNYPPVPPDTPCSDTNLCTSNERCDGAGRCVGDTTECRDAPSPECLPGDDTYRSYATVGSCEPSTGECDYPTIDIACPSCASQCLGICDGVTCEDLAGGCQTYGTCLPDLPGGYVCQHAPADDGTACDLDGDGTRDDGVCLEGGCVQCRVDADCPGLCEGCDTATNTCGTAVADDPACGIIDCLPDTACRDWQDDITTNRCAGVGTCLDSSACTFDDLPPTTRCGSGTDDACTDPDTCDGSGSCRPNHATAGSSCGDPTDTECDGADSCDGSGTCLDNLAGTGAPCGNRNDTACSNPDTCDGAGNCLANHETNGTACGNQSDTDCTDPNTCNGSGTCLANDATAGAPCGDQSDTTCTDPDTCDGNGSCLENNATDKTSCGSSLNTACTDPDTCNGQGSCSANHAAPGTACGNPSNAGCNAPDTCNSTGSCIDRKDTYGTACGSSTVNACTAADFCDGTGTCLPNHANAGTSCGDPSDTTCTDPDTCDGNGNCLANHASGSTVCRNATQPCDVTEYCSGGTCPGDVVADRCTGCSSGYCDGSSKSCRALQLSITSVGRYGWDPTQPRVVAAGVLGGTTDTMSSWQGELQYRVDGGSWQSRNLIGSADGWYQDLPCNECFHATTGACVGNAVEVRASICGDTTAWAYCGYAYSLSGHPCVIDCTTGTQIGPTCGCSQGCDYSDPGCP